MFKIFHDGSKRSKMRQMKFAISGLLEQRSNTFIIGIKKKEKHVQ